MTITPGATIVVGHLSQGFLLPADHYAFVTEEEILVKSVIVAGRDHDR
jgi:hypothetical protein